MRHAPSRTALVAIGLVFACSGLRAHATPESAAQRAVEAIEQAHGAQALRRRGVVHADLTVTFGGSTRVDGKIAFTPAGGHSRIEQKDGTTIVFDGTAAWVSPSSADATMARFHALTWPYFALLPFKLRDGGTTLTDAGTLPLTDGRALPAMKLTFAPGTGDAPDDWYLVYHDPETHRVVALAYIVTYGKSAEQAAKSEPHAVVYSDFQTFDGVTFPTTWTFHKWVQGQGVTGDPLGVAQFSNVRFGPVDEKLFTKPDDAKEDPLPKP